MDYIEKLKQKSAALRGRANAANQNPNYKIVLEHKADILADKAAKFQNFRENNPERYAKFAKLQKIIGYGNLIFWCAWLFVLAPLAIVLVESGKIKLVNQETAPKLGLGQETLRDIVGRVVPYSKWDEWGQPETLDGTNGRIWVAHLPNANLTFVSRKDSDIVLAAGFGKVSEDVAQLVAMAEKQMFQDRDGIALCSNYFDQVALYEGSKYHSVLGRGQTQYNIGKNTATFYVEATLVNGFGAEQRVITSCTVNMNYRLNNDGISAFAYIKDFVIPE